MHALRRTYGHRVWFVHLYIHQFNWMHSILFYSILILNSFTVHYFLFAIIVHSLSSLSSNLARIYTIGVPHSSSSLSGMTSSSFGLLVHGEFVSYKWAIHYNHDRPNVWQFGHSRSISSILVRMVDHHQRTDRTTFIIAITRNKYTAALFDRNCWPIIVLETRPSLPMRPFGRSN